MGHTASLCVSKGNWKKNGRINGGFGLHFLNLEDTQNLKRLQISIQEALLVSKNVELMRTVW